jgi:hypothetical protein
MALGAAADKWGVPLLASSCCLVQLALNALSVGCAGFNTHLGPLRPYFLGLFAALQFDKWQSAVLLSSEWTAAGISRQLAWSAIQTGVALLPEALDAYNHRKALQQVMADGSSSSSSPGATMKIKANVQLDVPTMGCVACIRAIDGALQGQAVAEGGARVVRASSFLNPLGIKGGVVKIVAEARDEKALSELVSRLIDATDSVGFAGATVASLRTQEQPERDPSVIQQQPDL